MRIKSVWKVQNSPKLPNVETFRNSSIDLGPWGGASLCANHILSLWHTDGPSICTEKQSERCSTQLVASWSRKAFQLSSRGSFCENVSRESSASWDFQIPSKTWNTLQNLFFGFFSTSEKLIFQWFKFLRSTPYIFQKPLRWRWCTYVHHRHLSGFWKSTFAKSNILNLPLITAFWRALFTYTSSHFWRVAGSRPGE